VRNLEEASRACGKKARERRVYMPELSPHQKVTQVLSDADLRARISSKALAEVLLIALRNANTATLIEIDTALSGHFGATTASSIILERQKLADKYGIVPLGPSQVEIKPKNGTDVITMLKEIDAFMRAIRGAGAVQPEYLRNWEQCQEFNRKFERELTIRVDGNVSGSAGLSGQEAVARGWNNVPTEILAACHAALNLVTGLDLFQGQQVRSLGYTLFYSRDGLAWRDYDDSAITWKGYSASKLLS